MKELQELIIIMEIELRKVEAMKRTDEHNQEYWTGRIHGTEMLMNLAKEKKAEIRPIK